MIRNGWRLAAVAVALGLAGCASAPMHYYTLIPPADQSADGLIPPANQHAEPMAPTAASMPFELLAVSIPAQVDQPQLVVRQGDQGVALLDGERWIAPLGDELRGALSADLARELQGQDATGLPDSGKPRLRIKLDVRRFDSQPGGYALIEGNWNVRILHGDHDAGVACSSRISETVGPGYDALVQGHQQAIGQLARQIAAAARALNSGQAATCPAS